MKKIIFVFTLCLCALPSFAMLSPGEFGIEMSGGYNFAALGNFNDNFTAVFNNGFLNGYASPKTATAIPGIFQADVKLRYAAASGFPLYLKLGFTRLVDTEILHDVARDLDIATSVASFNVPFVGAGIKYGFKLNPGFSIFLGADGGCFIPINSYWEVTGNTAFGPPVNNNTADPNYNAYQKIDFTDIFFGASAGAGFEWAISNSWGLILEGGYKIAGTPIAYTKTGIFTRASFNFNELDLSGPYATGGFVFYFGGKETGKQNGDSLFKNKDYKGALAVYAAEYKASPSVLTYKKIGICYYHLGMKDKAIFIFSRILKSNPNDREAASMLKRMKQ